jgi:hypothetical protein
MEHIKFNGVTAPDGEGMVLEVHLDIQKTTTGFTEWLNTLGFENDPFATFFPVGYIAHMTGRLRVLPKNIKDLLPKVNSLVAGVIQKAISEEHALYAEVELVREVLRFTPMEVMILDKSLDSFHFHRSGKFGGAKSDVHIEFPKGKVPDYVRDYLSSKEFYWVSTPQTVHCGAEEIATLQTTTYEAGRQVVSLLAQRPLPGCTAIHLEQKLSMVSTNYNLAMPEVISVIM